MSDQCMYLFYKVYKILNNVKSKASVIYIIIFRKKLLSLFINFIIL